MRTEAQEIAGALRWIERNPAAWARVLAFVRSAERYGARLSGYQLSKYVHAIAPGTKCRNAFYCRLVRIARAVISGGSE